MTNNNNINIKHTGYLEVVDHDLLELMRDDIIYVRGRVDGLHEDMTKVKVRLSGFMGKAAGISAAIAFAISIAGLLATVLL
jgi:hypothetical protein